MFGVGRVLHLGGRHRRILDSEVGDVGPVATEVSDQRVVGVQDQPGGRRHARHDVGPAIGDRLQLPVTVELVAEQVGDHKQ
jgi:hypothetical protein